MIKQYSREQVKAVTTIIKVYGIDIHMAVGSPEPRNTNGITAIAVYKGKRFESTNNNYYTYMGYGKKSTFPCWPVQALCY